MTRKPPSVPTLRPVIGRADQSIAPPIPRATAAARGYDAKWRKESAEYLRENPLCTCRCGCTARATRVDHCVPHKGDQVLFWDRTNWRAMCTHCHRSHKQRDERAIQP